MVFTVMETLYGFITSMGPQYGFITAMGPLYGFITATVANCYGGPLWLYHWHRGPKFLSNKVTKISLGGHARFLSFVNCYYGLRQV